MSKLRQIVLDGSVSLAWYFADEANPYADSIARLLPRELEAVVPTIWPLEVVNAFLTGERRKRSTPAQSAKWAAFFEMLPITIDGEGSTRAFREILSLARERGLSAYDAAYLEVAMRRGLPLATLDAKLKSAAIAVGVAIYSPNADAKCALSLEPRPLPRRRFDTANGHGFETAHDPAHGLVSRT